VNEGLYQPHSIEDFEALSAEFDGAVDLAARFPEWPFLDNVGYVAACEYVDSTSGAFGPVLAELVEYYGDETVTFISVDPDPDVLIPHSRYPAFRVQKEGLPDNFWKGVEYFPGVDVAAALSVDSDVAGIVGSSRRWAVWGQRDWEIALLLTPEREGPWLHADINFVDVPEALQNFRGPEGWTMPLSEAETATMLGNIARHRPDPPLDTEDKR